MDKLERLLNLTAALLGTERPLAAEDLWLRVPGYEGSLAARRRTFERDKDDLREMGVPLDVERVPGSNPPVDGYRIRPERYYLPDPGLEPDELAALHLATTLVSGDGLDGSEALWKLGGATAQGGGPAGPVVSIPVDPGLGLLFSAVTERRTARFRYRGEDRVVEPHRLDFRRGHWYLTAHDQARGEPRNYRVDRIEAGAPGSATALRHVSVEVGPPGAFVPPPSTTLVVPEGWELGEGDEVEARLLVDPAQAPAAELQLGEGAVEERRPDGSVIFRVPVRNPAGFRSFALGFLDGAEVLSPPALRADVVAWLEALVG